MEHLYSLLTKTIVELNDYELLFLYANDLKEEYTMEIWNIIQKDMCFSTKKL